ncbi:MAG TPA: hypothetical protein VJI67_04400 [archaeon]|nr:hypothetical protein [archaeon]HLD80915.1 hypothetical protein [archaeon]
MSEYEVCVEGSCGGGSCGGGNCGPYHESNAYDVMERRMRYLTMAAYKEILYDKIKQKLERDEGKKIEELASLLVETSKDKLRDRSDLREKREKLRSKLRETFEGTEGE